MRWISNANALSSLVLWTKNIDTNFSCWLVAFFLLILFSLPFMLRIFSGYLGCGLHYGRNGSPQNPFSRKGLYPWAACSSVWQFLWNERHPKKKKKVSSNPLFFIKRIARRSHPVSNYKNSISWILPDTSTCIHPPAPPTDIQTHLAPSSLTLAAAEALLPHAPWQSHEKPKIEFNSLLFHNWELNGKKRPLISSTCFPYHSSSLRKTSKRFI